MSILSSILCLFCRTTSRLRQKLGRLNHVPVSAERTGFVHHKRVLKRECSCFLLPCQFSNSVHLITNEFINSQRLRDPLSWTTAPNTLFQVSSTLGETAVFARALGVTVSSSVTSLNEGSGTERASLVTVSPTAHQRIRTFQISLVHVAPTLLVQPTVLDCSRRLSGGRLHYKVRLFCWLL